MRLYRGLKKPYSKRELGRLDGTDFTDCAYVALQFARGPKGVLLVLDIPDDVDPLTLRVTEELWPDSRTRRLMVWGSFDDYLASVIPAKEARKVVNAKGIAGRDAQGKSEVLAMAISRHMLAPDNPLEGPSHSIWW